MRIKLLNEENAELVSDKDGWWSIERHGEHIRYLDQYEANMIESTITASLQMIKDLE